MFDLNDFDETLPGPFEYDVKRMAASFTIAGRNNGFSKSDTRASTLASVRAYRQAMAEFAGMRTMDIWYAHLAEDELMRGIRSTVAEIETQAKAKKRGKGTPKDTAQEAKAARRAAKTAEKTREKAHTRDSLQALSKLGELVDGRYRIVSQPPIVVPARDLAATYGMSPDEVGPTLRDQLRAYQATLPDDRRHLLERFEIVDMARKVVGVGSVGTRAFIVLLQGRDAHDPLFLQVKEATASVLEDHLPRSRYKQHGERVVQGQRMMQAASDIFLGWTQGVDVQPPLLLAAAARHEGLGHGGVDGPVRAHLVCRNLWVDPGPGARSIGGSGRDLRMPGRRRHVRPSDHRLLGTLCRSERAGLSEVRGGGPIGSAASARGRLTMRSTNGVRCYRTITGFSREVWN